MCWKETGLTILLVCDVGGRVSVGDRVLDYSLDKCESHVVDRVAMVWMEQRVHGIFDY